MSTSNSCSSCTFFGTIHCVQVSAVRTHHAFWCLDDVPPRNYYILLVHGYYNYYELLTKRARGPYWGILARGRGSTDRAQRGPYKNDRGQYSPVRLELARLVSSLLWLLISHFRVHVCLLFKTSLSAKFLL